jgi:protein-S-isoprenylcysteine O-methyltransferase Ste14
MTPGQIALIILTIIVVAALIVLIWAADAMGKIGNQIEQREE